MVLLCPGRVLRKLETCGGWTTRTTFDKKSKHRLWVPVRAAAGPSGVTLSRTGRRVQVDTDFGELRTKRAVGTYHVGEG